MKLILFVILFITGCTINLNLDHEYAVNSGSGEISESTAVEEKTETTADIKADTGGL